MTNPLSDLPMFQRRATPELERMVMQRDGHRCRYCGAVATELDHVQPYSRGGLTVVGNLVAACSLCNQSKGDRTPEEWRQAQAVQRLARTLGERRTGRGRIKAVISKTPAPPPPPYAYLAELLRDQPQASPAPPLKRARRRR
jgi:hypothetical protein